VNFDDINPDMTLEELEAKLRELGIPHNKWKPAGGQTVQPPRIEKYKALLVSIRTLLEGQVDRDKQQISELHSVLQRAKHGGGI
jgi:hypothetical protein